MSTRVAGALVEVRKAEIAPWRRWYRRNERLVYGLLGFVSVTAAWELAARFGWLKATFVSSPSRILTAAQGELTQGRIWGDVTVSLEEPDPVTEAGTKDDEMPEGKPLTEKLTVSEKPFKGLTETVYGTLPPWTVD